MKILATLALALTLVSCTTKTEYGPCIGAFDTQDPRLTYSTSGWNILLGVILLELIIPPVVVIASEIQCPVGVK